MQLTKTKLVKKSVSIVVGGKTKIKVKNVPKGARVTYKSAQKKVATVSKKGIVKGIKSGTAKIIMFMRVRNARQLNNTGIEYYNASQYEKAADTFLQAAEKDKDGSAEYYANLGKTYIELGQYDKAGEAFLNALSNVTDDKTALWGMGVVSYYTGDYASSMEYFGRIVDNISDYDDTDMDSLQYYASLQSYYNDCAGAIDSYTVLIRKKA